MHSSFAVTPSRRTGVDAMQPDTLTVEIKRVAVDDRLAEGRGRDKTCRQCRQDRPQQAMSGTSGSAGARPEGL